MLNKFNFDYVPYKQYGPFTNYDEFCNNLKDIYKVVAESKLNKEEEGSVLYFISNF
jgi:hypothetical protein